MIYFNNDKINIGALIFKDLNTIITTIGNIHQSIFFLSTVNARGLLKFNCPGPSPRLPNDVRNLPSCVNTETQ